MPIKLQSKYSFKEVTTMTFLTIFARRDAETAKKLGLNPRKHPVEDSPMYHVVVASIIEWLTIKHKTAPTFGEQVVLNELINELEEKQL
jgi:hypothetical protein